VHVPVHRVEHHRLGPVPILHQEGFEFIDLIVGDWVKPWGAVSIIDPRSWLISSRRVRGTCVWRCVATAMRGGLSAPGPKPCERCRRSAYPWGFRVSKVPSGIRLIQRLPLPVRSG
jgi:hypothetical protein